MKQGRYITTITIDDCSVNDVIDKLTRARDVAPAGVMLFLDAEYDDWNDALTGKFSIMAYTQDEIDHNENVSKLMDLAESLGYEIRKKEKCASVQLPGDMSSISILDNLSGIQLLGK